MTIDEKFDEGVLKNYESIFAEMKRRIDSGEMPIAVFEDYRNALGRRMSIPAISEYYVQYSDNMRKNNP